MKKTNLKSFFIFCLIFVSFLFFSVNVFAQPISPIDPINSPEPTLDDDSLVKCGTEKSPVTTDATGKQTGGEILNPCGWNDFLALINTIVNFVLFRLAIPIAAIMFAYAGFELLFSGGSEEKKTKAKSIFTNVAIGLAIAAAAWLMVNTVLSVLGYDGCWIGFGNDCQ